LTHDPTQPTLAAPHDGSLEDRVGRLGFTDSIALLAFELSKDDAAPISPTLRFSRELGDRLRGQGILRITDAALTDPGHRLARALYDPLTWEYLNERSTSASLLQLVRLRLQRFDADTVVSEMHQLWRSLADAEFEGYFAHLLRRHQLEPAWAGSVAERVHAELMPLSLVQRRALAWSVAKEGAAAHLRTRRDAQETLETMVQHARREARHLMRFGSLDRAWHPHTNARQPLVVSAFLAQVELRDRYWTNPPAVSTLKQSCA
jgi:hypothetical protein